MIKLSMCSCAALPEAANDARASNVQQDAQTVHENLRVWAAGNLNDGAVSVEKVAAANGADDWDSVRAKSLPPRPDSHCDDSIDPDLSRKRPACNASVIRCGVDWCR